MTITQQLLSAEAAPSDQTLRAFDAVNFFVGGALAGFGPFVALFLGDQGWHQEDIGFAPGRNCRFASPVPWRGTA